MIVSRAACLRQTCHRWRNECGGLKRDQVKQLKELEAQNGRLRRVVSDPALDKMILNEAQRGRRFVVSSEDVIRSDSMTNSVSVGDSGCDYPSNLFVCAAPLKIISLGRERSAPAADHFAAAQAARPREVFERRSVCADYLGRAWTWWRPPRIGLDAIVSVV